MQQALEYKAEHPQTTFRKLSELFNVPASTINDRYKNTHPPRGNSSLRNLSIEQENALVSRINAYAQRGTLLQPMHITQLAELMCGRAVGRNWTSTFLKRHKDSVTSKYFERQEMARLKADIPETRQAFYKIVSNLLVTMRCLTGSP
jgi:hypothetical protein